MKINNGHGLKMGDTPNMTIGNMMINHWILWKTFSDTPKRHHCVEITGW
jgi:hypothetical protein